MFNIFFLLYPYIIVFMSNVYLYEKNDGGDELYSDLLSVEDMSGRCLLKLNETTEGLRGLFLMNMEFAQFFCLSDVFLSPSNLIKAKYQSLKSKV